MHHYCWVQRLKLGMNIPPYVMPQTGTVSCYTIKMRSQCTLQSNCNGHRWTVVMTNYSAYGVADDNRLISTTLTKSISWIATIEIFCFERLLQRVRSAPRVLCWQNCKKNSWQPLRGPYKDYSLWTDWSLFNKISMSWFIWRRAPQYETWFWTTNWKRAQAHGL